MAVELRHLRCLVAIVDAGTLTDAAIALGVSQAAVSRTLAGLEAELGVRLLHRTARQVTPTAAGSRVLPRARRLLADADQLVADAAGGTGRLRIGHAWSAMGRHTLDFQRRWAAAHPTVELHLVRTNSPSAGLAEGACDVAVVRTEPDARRFDSALVGVERRLCAVAADDPWARRRSLPMAAISERTLLIDRRTGTTTPEMWPAGARPAIEYTNDVDDWLTAIATGRCVGVTAEGTAAQYRRPEVVYRPIRDAEPIAVRLAWDRRPAPGRARRGRPAHRAVRAGLRPPAEPGRSREGTIGWCRSAPVPQIGATGPRSACCSPPWGSPRAAGPPASPTSGTSSPG